VFLYELTSDPTYTMLRSNDYLTNTGRIPARRVRSGEAEC
jgi:hypothetical protein